MPKFVRVADGQVVEVVQAPDQDELAKRYHPSIKFIPAPDDVEEFYTFDGGEFYPPEQAQVDEVESPPPPDRLGFVKGLSKKRELLTKHPAIVLHISTGLWGEMGQLLNDLRKEGYQKDADDLQDLLDEYYIPRGGEVR